MFPEILTRRAWTAERALIILGIAGLLALLAYKYRHGEATLIRLHDYADAYIPIFKIMNLSDVFTFERTFDPYMGGVERNVLGSEFNIGLLIHVIFPPFIAILTNEAIIKLTAFVGMYLFLEKSIEIRLPLISFSTSFAFACLPFFPPIYLTIAGLPLVAWALINISRNKHTATEYLICFFFPMFIAIQGLPGIALFLFSMLTIDWIINRRISYKALFVLGGMIFFLFVIEWRLFYIRFFDEEFQSHRQAITRWFISPDTEDYWHTVWRHSTSGILSNEKMHSASYHQKTLSPLIVGATLLSVFATSKRPPPEQIRAWVIAIPIVIVASAALRLGFFIVQAHFPAIMEFNMQRIMWMYPPLLYIAYAASGAYIARLIGTKMARLAIVFVLAMVMVLQAHYLVRMEADPEHYRLASFSGMTYKEFFAEPIFNKIKAHLEQDSGVERVVSIGIHPAAALFNGLKTADGYWYLYNNAYKQDFRRVIEGELEINSELQSYYDNWGHRVYMFFHQQKTMTWRKPEAKRMLFHYNTNAMKELSVSHVLSVHEVENADELSWTFISKFCDTEISYCINLYRI